MDLKILELQEIKRFFTDKGYNVHFENNELVVEDYAIGEGYVLRFDYDASVGHLVENEVFEGNFIACAKYVMHEIIENELQIIDLYIEDVNFNTKTRSI